MKTDIRSSQLLSPFGIGQIVNFPGELSYMICGLNLWDDELEARRRMGETIDMEELTILEPRLQALLNVQGFRKPFPYISTGSANRKLEVPGVRFPQWHYCTNIRCGVMRKIELTLNDEPRCERCAEDKKMFKMIPVRFVAACTQGHIQDIPFREWVHNGPIPRDNNMHGLSYHATSGSGDLSSIVIKCTCGSSRSLGGLMNVSKSPEGNVFNSALAAIGLTEDEKNQIEIDNPNNGNLSGQYCKGSRPWLGPRHLLGQCGNHLHVIIRGGSNIHYSDIISALYLPEFDVKTSTEAGKIINDLGLEVLISFYNQTEDHMVLRAILQTRPQVQNNLISVEKAFDDIERVIKDHEDDNDEQQFNTELKLRLQEYQYIQNGRNSENADFKSIVKSFENYNGREFLEKYFEKTVLVEKLKETRVFRSFARIDPSNKLNTSELSDKEISWLPAYQVFGEGIFLQFKKEVTDKWLENFCLNEHPLLQRYHENVLSPNSRHEEGLNPVFVMMHTFSHLLIKRLCFNCGYGSSSLRERIYFSINEDYPMQGILIYTSSGDSEGSLGGLVRQGNEKYLYNLINEAIADAEWCSADPVCSDIGQNSGQGPDNVNGSACHNCCIVPETSCEEFNMLLDRGLVVGNLGYFKI